MSPEKHLPWQQRAEEETVGKVTVSVAVLTSAETRNELGIRLDRARIQAVWVKVTNGEQTRYFIPPITIDSGYYSPLEAAWTGHGWFSAKKNARIDEHVYSRRLPVSVEPGATVSGFVFTTLDKGVKYISLELIGAGNQGIRRFAFLAPVIGLKTDYHRVRWDKLYAPDEHRDLNEGGLRQWLEQLPPCTKGPNRTTDGDPLNIVMIGSNDAVFPSLARRGWHVTEATRLTSSWLTIKSSIFGSLYRYAPVSSLYALGRRQDLALQKPRANVNQRNHMRLWLAPVTVDGTRVWFGQISRDIGVRLTRKTITTHKIDPNIDESRWYLVQDMFFSQGLRRHGWVKGVGAAPPENPRHNYTGDPYFTDGLRAVLWMSEEPISYHHIEQLSWDLPPVFS